jgi:hypothetical protein
MVLFDNHTQNLGLLLGSSTNGCLSRHFEIHLNGIKLLTGVVCYFLATDSDKIAHHNLVVELVPIFVPKGKVADQEDV